MMNVITIGLGMILVAGPLLAVMFRVAWTLLVDPDPAYDLLEDNGKRRSHRQNSTENSEIPE